MTFIKKQFDRLLALDKRIKFIIVGCLNTLIGYGVSALILLLYFKLPIDAQAALGQIGLSSVAGHAAGMINSYFCNKYFTFGKRGYCFFEVVRFATVSAAQLFLTVFLQKLIQDTQGLPVYAAMAITLVATTIFGYVMHNVFTFPTDKAQCKPKDNDILD